MPGSSPLYAEAPLQIVSIVLAVQLVAITHLAGMARGNGILLEPHLFTTQSVSMPDTCGLSLTLQSCIIFLPLSPVLHTAQLHNLFKRNYTGTIHVSC